MGLLDGGLAAIFSAALSGLYLDGVLHAGTGSPIYGPGGMITGYAGGSDVPIKVQTDSTGDSLKAALGYAPGDVQLIVLAHGVPQIGSDNEITDGHGVRYSVQSVERDAAGSHYVIRGRPV